MEIILIYLLILPSVPEQAKRDKLLNNGWDLITGTKQLEKKIGDTKLLNTIAHSGRPEARHLLILRLQKLMASYDITNHS